MEFIKVFLLIGFLALTKCAPNQPTILNEGLKGAAPTPAPPTGGGNNGPSDNPKTYLAFIGLNLDGSNFELNSTPTRARVLIFSQDTCTVCAEEAKAISKELHKIGGSSKSVEFATVLVGLGDILDGKDWVEKNGVIWPVVYQPGDSTFIQYCPEKKTPCTLIDKPQEGIVFYRNGKVTVEDIKTITGDW